TDQGHRLPGPDREGDVVDDVDVAVALGEADAQVAHLEQRRLVAVVDEAVTAGELDLAELGELLLQGRAGRRGVGRGGGAGRGGDLVPGGEALAGGLGRDHRVGEALGEDVEAQDGDHDRQAGEEG